MTCYTQYSLSPPTTKTCPDGQNLCYKRLELPNAPENWRSRRTCLCHAWVPLRSRSIAGQSKQCKERNKFFRGCAAACPKAEHNE
ncbi:hypothetical protein L345_17632, partial [Ophiophagus hannah]